MFDELVVEAAMIAELTKAQSNGHPDGLYYADLARATGQNVYRVKQVAKKSPRLQVATPLEHRGRRLVSLVAEQVQPLSIADAIGQMRPRKPQQQVVYRLRYQWPARDEDGEPIEDAQGRTEWGAVSVRYYWTRAGLEAKLRRILDPPRGGAPARVRSIEVARVSAFRGIRA